MSPCSVLASLMPKKTVQKRRSIFLSILVAPWLTFGLLLVPVGFLLAPKKRSKNASAPQPRICIDLASILVAVLAPVGSLLMSLKFYYDAFHDESFHLELFFLFHYGFHVLSLRLRMCSHCVCAYALTAFAYVCCDGCGVIRIFDDVGGIVFPHPCMHHNLAKAVKH